MGKVAVVGAGFSGLALCWTLLAKGCQVDLYEQKEVGGGASGVAAGLLHPYAGEEVKRSWEADAALEEAKKLLLVAQGFSEVPVADFSGLIRRVTSTQGEILEKHALTYGDVKRLSETEFLLESGIAVYSSIYLEALYKACLSKGLKFFRHKVGSFSELEAYDFSFFAIGCGIFSFEGIESMPIKPVRGQALLCDWPSDQPLLERAVLGKGYIVPLPNQEMYVGSTYERGLCEETPDISFALPDLEAKAKVLVPGLRALSVKECRAGVRVGKSGHYAPILAKVGSKAFVLTAMGSRGLLYHALMAKKLVEQAVGE